jgi:hypothetical protein
MIYVNMSFAPKKGLEEPQLSLMFRPPLRFLGRRQKPGGETNQGRKQLFLGRDFFGILE